MSQLMHYIREAVPSDIKRCIDIRGKTRENPASIELLESYGVTEESWSQNVATGKTLGSVCEVNGEIVGYSFADTNTAEILVLALLPEFENQGIGKGVLKDCMAKMKKLGHKRLWLAASPDPNIRAYGFYRHLGWAPTGETDAIQDEILEYFL